MRIRNIQIAMIAAVMVLSSSMAGALDVNSNIVTILTGPGGTALGDLVIDGDGNATATIAPGNVIQVSYTVTNAPADLIAGIFLTTIHSGAQLDFLGAPQSATSILVGGTAYNPNGLNNIGSGQVKVNSPTPDDNNPATSGPVWIQSIAFGSGGGGNGVGPDLAVTLAYQIVAGVGANDGITFTLQQTAGDGVSGQSVLTLSNATVNVPEPGALALALGSLGTVGCVVRIRRRL